MTFKPRITLGSGAAILALAGFATSASALSLSFPVPARMTGQEVIAEGEAALPVARFAAGTVATETGVGRVTRSAWKLPGRTLTTAQLLKPLRDQLQQDGYDIRFSCADTTCGGFDFRYAVDLLHEPDMHVDLGDYRYLVAERPGEDGPELVSLMVSRSASAGYVQLTRVAGEDAPKNLVTSSKSQIDLSGAAMPGKVAGDLGAEGHVPLDDLVFETGSADLGAGPFPSLTALASELRANPDSRVVLVGHTDAEGSLEGNIALSRRRAESVRDRLVGALDVPAAQVSAEGVGYLAPRASNLSDDGRRANRRVEVILTQ